MLRELLPAHPTAIIEEDGKGRIPFTEVLVDWIQERRAARARHSFKESDRRRDRMNVARLARSVMSLRNVSSFFSRGDATDGENGGASTESVDDSLRNLGPLDPGEKEGNPHLARESGYDILHLSNRTDDGDAAHDLPALVEWSLRILSAIVDQRHTIGLGCANSNSSFGNGMTGSVQSFLSDGDMSSGMSTRDSTDSLSVQQAHSDNTGMNLGAFYSELAVEKISSIPHLMEELLLIADDEARRRVFGLLLVHQVLFCQASLGDGKWLIEMLSKGIYVGGTSLSGKATVDEGCAHAESAVFYLERVSLLSLRDDPHFFCRWQGQHVILNQPIPDTSRLSI